MANNLILQLQYTIGLICQLWEQSFKEDHLKSGFKKAGLFPVPSEMDDVISPTAMAPSVPFRHQDSSTEDDNNDVCLDVCCRKCGGAITQMKLHLAVYFAKELQYKPTTNAGKKDKRKV